MKYIIEFEDKPIIKNDGKKVFAAKNFNSLFFDDVGLNHLEALAGHDKELEKQKRRMYEEGIRRGWKAMYDLFAMPIGQAERIIGVPFSKWQEADPVEARKKLIDYQEDKNKIVVGDEVVCKLAHENGTKAKFVVTTVEREDGKTLISGFGVDALGHEGSFLSREADRWEKTGKHYDEIELLYTKIGWKTE